MQRQQFMGDDGKKHGRAPTHLPDHSDARMQQQGAESD